MASESSYEYRHLENQQHIRLLRLAPGNEFDTVKISLLHAIHLARYKSRTTAIENRWARSNYIYKFRNIAEITAVQ